MNRTKKNKPIPSVVLEMKIQMQRLNNFLQQNPQHPMNTAARLEAALANGLKQ